MNFIDVFTKLCNEQNKSPTSVCEELNLSNAIYTHWRKNGSIPRPATIKKIADYFKVSEDYLLGKTDVRLVTQDSDESPNAFLRRLNELLDEAHLSRKKFLQDVNFGKNQITYWENNNSVPNPSTLNAIANYFHVSVDYLLGQTDVRVPPSEDDGDDLQDYLEELRSRPEMRMLFSLAKGATKEDVERAVAIIEALRKSND